MPDPTEAEIEAAMPVFLQHMEDSSPEWAGEFLAFAKTEPHKGDCPLAEHQGPITCNRCVWEEIHWKTEAVLMAARNSEPSAATEWRDIETAPRDGTHLWLFWPDEHPDDRQAVGRWREGIHGGYWMSHTDIEAQNPTHWISLPGPPTAIDTPVEEGDAHG